MGDTQLSLTSIGYLVKIPTSPLPPSVDGNGLYGVQLRIAKGQVFHAFAKQNVCIWLVSEAHRLHFCTS